MSDDKKQCLRTLEEASSALALVGLLCLKARTDMQREPASRERCAHLCGVLESAKADAMAIRSRLLTEWANLADVGAVRFDFNDGSSKGEAK